MFSLIVKGGRIHVIGCGKKLPLTQASGGKQEIGVIMGLILRALDVLDGSTVVGRQNHRSAVMIVRSYFK
jgi:hypothetical protein